MKKFCSSALCTIQIFISLRLSLFWHVQIFGVWQNVRPWVVVMSYGFKNWAADGQWSNCSLMSQIMSPAVPSYQLLCNFKSFCNYKSRPLLAARIKMHLLYHGNSVWTPDYCAWWESDTGIPLTLNYVPTCWVVRQNGQDPHSSFSWRSCWKSGLLMWPFVGLCSSWWCLKYDFLLITSARMFWEGERVGRTDRDGLRLENNPPSTDPMWMISPCEKTCKWYHTTELLSSH